jgi:hypothetical protein
LPYNVPVSASPREPQSLNILRNADAGGTLTPLVFSFRAWPAARSSHRERRADMRGDGELTIAKIESAIDAILAESRTKRVLPFAAVIALTHRIQWFDKGEATNIAQHHHAWVVFDHAHPIGRPPTLLFAD